MFEIPSIKNVSECNVKFDKKANNNVVELISTEGEKIKYFISKKVA